LGISKNTILSRKLKLSKQIKIPSISKLGCSYEVDEMFVKIANGKFQNWLTYAIEQKTRAVVGFCIGSKSILNIKQVVDKVLLLKPKNNLY
jgi:insertion element IS1 protein InsB